MATITKTTLAYTQDTHGLFAKLRHLPWAVYLDSSQPYAEQGRYDIISACPHTTLVTHGETTEINNSAGTQQSTEDPFHLLQNALAPHEYERQNLPFIGGAIGYFSYDLGRRLEKLPETASKDIHIADMAVGIYDWAIVIDHQQQQCQLVAANSQAQTADVIREVTTYLQKQPNSTDASFRLQQAFQSNMTREEYYQRFDRVMHYIREGDCYEANLTQRFSATYQGDPWLAYQQLREHNPAPYAAYMNIPDGTILSLSPERFLLVDEGQVISKPMKGTRPRGATPEEDQQLAEELALSEKDRAENVMIVDLIRNDIGKVCQTGSVHVPHLFAIETFPAVHQMVSTVTGRLLADKHPVDLLRACFPGGSITGAPKIRAMEIIEELEPQRRNIYCGSIGYISYDQHMDTNIAIRTLLCYDDHIHCAAGGALVADSEQEAEYQESLDKITLMCELLEAM